MEKAREYLQSIKEYTVYTEEKGRYFDSKNAYYSWRDYKIPTEVAAIEAIKTITPTDGKTLVEMQRWLLQEKRTQAWDTPLNSVNAIWAFMNNGNWLMQNGEHATLMLDNKPLQTTQPTAGLGYVKATQTVDFQSSEVMIWLSARQALAQAGVLSTHSSSRRQQISLMLHLA